MADDNAILGRPKLIGLYQFLEPSGHLLAVAVEGGHAIILLVAVQFVLAAVQKYDFQVTPAVGIVDVSALVREIVHEMARHIATRLMVAAHDLEGLVLCKQAYADIDIAAVGFVVAILQVIGHVPVVDDAVAGLVIEQLQQRHQRVGVVVHVAGNEDMVLRLVGVLCGKSLPRRGIHVARPHKCFHTIRVVRMYLVGPHAILVSGARLQSFCPDGKVLHRDSRVLGAQYLAVSLHPSVHRLEVFRGLCLPFLANLYPRYRRDAMFKYHGNSVWGEFLQVRATCKPCLCLGLEQSKGE